MVAQAVTRYTGILRKDLRLFPADQQRLWTLYDPVADRYFRLGEVEYQVLSRLHDNMPVERLMVLLAAGGCDVSEEEINSLLGFLSINGLLQPVYGKSHQRVREMQSRLGAVQRRRLLGTWLSMRFPLVRPQPILDKTWPIVRHLLNPVVLTVLCLLALIGYSLLLLRLPQLTAVFQQSLSPQGMLRYGMAIAVIKLLHELAHAYAAHWAGVPVRVMGVGIIVFLPRLYTDVTDSWRIHDRRKRMIIDGAGMAIEVVLGGLAALIWTTTGPGTLHSICYYIVTVSALNTLLINGNPLLRFDGYYLLMDATGIDNLGTRANILTKNLFRRLLFGLPAIPPNDSVRLRLALAVYGMLAGVYRIVLYSGLIMLIAGHFLPMIGLLLASCGLLTFAGLPMLQEAQTIYRQRAHMQRGRASLSCLLLLAFMAAVFVPLPWNLNIPCLVKAKECQRLYVETPGYLETALADDSGERTVQQGDVIYRLVNPLLGLKLQETEYQMGELQLEIDQLMSKASTLAMAKVKQQQLLTLEAARSEIERKLAAMTLQAPCSGTLVWYKPEEMEIGRWFSQGAELGEIFSSYPTTVQAFLPELELANISEGQSASIILPDRLTPINGIVKAIGKTPEKTMPLSPILDIFGGPVATRRQDQEFIPQDSWYEILIEIDGDNTLTPGRSGTVSIARYRSLGISLCRLLLEIVRRDIF